MVGMRYQDPNGIRLAKDTYNKYKTLGVKLVSENNPNGVNGKAIAVYHKGYNIGYIRNKDLSDCFGAILNHYTYTVTTIHENYWVIETSSTYIGPTAFCSPAINISQINDKQTYKQEYETQYIQEPIKSEQKMNISSNIRDSFFREMKNVAIDFQSGKFGVVSSDGISVYTDGAVSVNPITEFGIKIPAFAMRIAVADLKDGDIIINGNEYSFFKGLTDQGYEVVSLNGEVKQVGSVTNLFFGKNSVLAVKNMFSGSSGNMNPMMMALMLGDSKEFDMKTFAMMSMMGGGQVDSNMLMMLALMGK